MATPAQCPLGSAYLYDSLQSVPAGMSPYDSPPLTIDIFGGNVRIQGGAFSGPGPKGYTYTPNYANVALDVISEWRYSMVVISLSKFGNNIIAVGQDTAATIGASGFDYWSLYWTGAIYRIAFAYGATYDGLGANPTFPLKIEVRETKNGVFNNSNQYLYINDVPAASSLGFVRGGFFPDYTRTKPGWRYSSNPGGEARVANFYVVGKNLPSTCSGEQPIEGNILPSSSANLSHLRILKGSRSASEARAFHNVMKGHTA